MSTQKGPEKQIFSGRCAASETTFEKTPKIPESRVNPPAPRAASKQHYAVSEIHLIDSHTYRVDPDLRDAPPRIATVRG